MKSTLISLIYHTRIITKHIGLYKAYSPTKDKEFNIPSLEKSKVLVQTVPHLANPFVMRVWLAPPVNNSDVHPLDVLCIILNCLGRMYDLYYLKDHRGITYSIPSLTYHADRKLGLISFSAATAPEKLQPVLDLFDKEIEQLVKHPPTQEEVKQAVRAITISNLKQLRYHDLMSPGLARHRALDTDSLEETLEKYEKVTPQDVQRVAKYLVKPSVTMVVSPEEVMKKAGFEQNKLDEPPTEKLIQWPSEKLAEK